MIIRALRITLSILLLGLAFESQSAPKAELWDRWLAHDAQSEETINHHAWSQLLNKYVVEGQDNLNRVAYQQVTHQDKYALKQYIKNISKRPISRFNRQQQRAFWINLYNALTVDIILDHYPVKSILEIKLSSGLFTRGPWKKKIVTIEEEELSLDDIEHRILRPIWQDPRTHYAVNCASIGCPNLSKQAFTAQNMDEQLNRAAESYINHPRGAEINKGKLVVSSIYEWFKEDFEGDDQGVIRHLKQYAKPELLKQLVTIQRIDDDQYDWQLNEYNVRATRQ